jgi:hypothetical protein
VDWIKLAQDNVVGLTFLNTIIIYGSVKFRELLGHVT